MKKLQRYNKRDEKKKHDEKSYCDSFIECVLLKCMRDVANGTHYNLHRFEKSLPYTNTRARAHTFRVRINRQVLELKLEETYSNNKKQKQKTIAACIATNMVYFSTSSFDSCSPVCIYCILSSSTSS